MQGLDTAISWMLYLSITGGFISFAYDDILWWSYKARAYRSLRMKLSGTKPESAFNGHLKLLLAATANGKISVTHFKWITGILFLTVFFWTTHVMGASSGIFYSLMFAAIPYMMLRIRHKAIQSRGSSEAEQLLNSLISEYKLSGRNMEEAVERTIERCKGIKNCKRLLTPMLYQIRETRDARKIKESTDVFAYGIGTNWAFLLSWNLYMSVTAAIDVSSSLDDILDGLKNAKKLLELRKQSNSEGIKLGKFATPILYLVFFFVAVYLMDTQPYDILYRQIATPEGLKMLSGICLMFIFNYALITLVGGKKFDF